ncbi:MULTISPECIES: tyrosine recombinase XerC [Silvimonas]|uniref:tyrosine recombinase XerC n=1 Tax=Silvimonas TaxID=300264 RepID=UPI0024B32B74|nr:MULTISPECIES: tyrosine recombinase XerC [Silvimonas]MDR3427027.1 tyrosine recombinase XerC [Silvimonas sp.]
MNEALLARFSQYLEGEKHASPETRKAYLRDLHDLVALAQNTPLNELTALDVRGFVRQLASRGLSAYTIARMLSAWRTFYRLMARDLGWQLDPAASVKPPKKRQRLPKAMDVDATIGLLDNMPDDEMISCRDKAIFELAYSSGLRVSELVGLQLADVDLGGGLARVTGKGNKTRMVPIGTAALDELRHWLKMRAMWAKPDCTTVFVGKQGAQLTTRAVQLRFKAWEARLGVTEPLHPHKLRHSCATHLLQSSGDLRAVQELLGHANLSTTQVYTHLDWQALAKGYDAFHPRAKRKDDEET